MFRVVCSIFVDIVCSRLLNLPNEPTPPPRRGGTTYDAPPGGWTVVTPRVTIPTYVRLRRRSGTAKSDVKAILCGRFSFKSHQPFCRRGEDVQCGLENLPITSVLEERVPAGIGCQD